MTQSLEFSTNGGGKRLQGCRGREEPCCLPARRLGARSEGAARHRCRPRRRPSARLPAWHFSRSGDGDWRRGESRRERVRGRPGPARRERAAAGGLRAGPVARAADDEDGRLSLPPAAICRDGRGEPGRAVPVRAPGAGAARDCKSDAHHKHDPALPVCCSLLTTVSSLISVAAGALLPVLRTVCHNLENAEASS